MGREQSQSLRLHDVACGMTGVAVQTDGTLYVETVSDSGSTYEAVIEDVEYAVTGAEYTLVLKQDGTLWTWNSAGEGDVSQIMDGIVSSNRMVPTYSRYAGTIIFWALVFNGDDLAERPRRIRPTRLPEEVYTLKQEDPPPSNMMPT